MVLVNLGLPLLNLCEAIFSRRILVSCYFIFSNLKKVCLGNMHMAREALESKYDFFRSLVIPLPIVQCATLVLSHRTWEP